MTADVIAPSKQPEQAWCKPLARDALRNALRRAEPTRAQCARWVAAVAERRDRLAFERLFDHFAPRLNAYLQRRGVDRGTAEEIVQDTMVTLWRKAALFDPRRSSPATWLYRIALNCRIDRLRRDRLEFLDGADPALDGVYEPDLISHLDLRRREEALRAALDGLPDEQLVLVRLAFFDELSHSQISERVGLPLGTVKSRIRLGFARLRRSLVAGGVGADEGGTQDLLESPAALP